MCAPEINPTIIC